MRRSKLADRGVPTTLVAMTVALLLVIAAFVGGCGGEEKGASPPAEEETSERGAAEPAETTDPAQVETASIGDVVTVGDVQWSVTDAEELDELASNKGEYEPGNFVIVDIALRNNSNQDLTVATPFLTLVDDQGRESEAEIDTNFTYLYPEENMFVEPARPGTVKQGKAIFAVEPDGSGFKLQVGEARFASGKTASIDLGI